jgi:hypothetical protein
MKSLGSRPCEASQKGELMKNEFEEYLETGILGGYIPERVLKRENDRKVIPVFRDASYWETAESVELHREMLISGRRFLVHSVFPKTAAVKTPTEQMLRIIDSGVEKI